MPKNLPAPHLFALWWFVKTPKRIATIIGRILAVLNNQISFTVNLRLIFTPLFGDYTVVGRMIGFTVRIFEIVFGLMIMAVIAVTYPILPILWILLPFYALYKEGIIVLFVLAGIYLIWGINNKNTPEKHVKDCGDDYMRSFRPKALKLLDEIIKNPKEGLRKLLDDPKLKLLVAKLEIPKEEFIEKISPLLINNTTDIARNAFSFAKEASATYVAEISIFVGMVKVIPNVEVVLAAFNSKPRTVFEGAKWIIKEREAARRIYIWQENYDGLITGGFGHGMTGRVTPYLDSMSEDFTKQALRAGYDRYAVRKDTIEKLAELLNASSENIIIAGQPGSGKTSLVRGMAYEIMRGTKYKSLWNKRIVSLGISGVLAGTRSVGEIAEKLKWAIGEAKASGNIILFIDEIHTLVASEGGNSEVAAIFSLLEPELSSGGIQFIGATSMQNYRKYIEPNGAFSRLFHLFEITEATSEETFKILEFVVKELEYKKKIFITYVALEKCIELSKKLIHERVLPDKAIQILDRASTYVESKSKVIDSKVIAEVIAEITHVPSAMVTEDEAKKLLNIEDEMKQMVIGQDHAIKQISSALKRARAGIRNENKPIASFLFVGTTGVGKTQTAKALAKTYFGDSKAMIRLDMSEYQQIDSLSRLLGTPDGGTKGILTEAVRTRPFALILLDELEKAHSNILLTFLQVLDDGRLTDSSGVTIDFTNTIIIATSNVGTRSIQQIFEQNGTFEQMNEAAMKDVRANYAPEFLNRFSGIIVFNPLSLDNVKEITKLMLNDVTKAAKDKNIKVTFTPELLEELVRRGYSKEWGARPLARVLEDTVETYIAENILAGNYVSGNEITIGLEALK